MAELSKTIAFDLHARALGVLCITWATLDRHLTDLLADMVPCTRKAAACLAMADNVAPRCETIKKLAYEKGFQDEWCETLGAGLDNILNLARSRNRFVHDYWAVQEGQLERLDKRALVKSKGAKLGKELVFETWHKHLPEEVSDLSVKVAQAIVFIQVARLDAQSEHGVPLQEPTMLKRMGYAIANPKQTQPSAPKQRRPPQS